MFISSIRRWRSGLIAAVRMVSSIGGLLLVERSRNAQPAPGPCSINVDQLRIYSFINTQFPSREAGSFFHPKRLLKRELLLRLN
jgi:hypothetical protein